MPKPMFYYDKLPLSHWHNIDVNYCKKQGRAKFNIKKMDPTLDTKCQPKGTDRTSHDDEKLT